MLKKTNRLKKTEDIDFVFKNGRSEFNKIFGLKYLKTNNKNNQFAIIIGKKVTKSAVERNRIKRIIKHNIIKENNKLKSGYDCVFVILTEIINRDDLEIKNQIIKTFQKIKLYV